MRISERFGVFSVRWGSAHRTPGVHLSDVLRFMAVEAGVLKPGEEDEDLDLMLSKYPHWQRGDSKIFNRIALGLAWEDWYSRQQPEDVAYHPGEYVLDGVIGTPDAVQIPESLDPVVHEFKLTWRSSRRPVQEEWLYWSQLKAYCRMVGSLRGVLHVYYVNGDYSGSGPLLKVYDAEFARREVDDTWNAIMKHRDCSKPEPGR